MLLDHGAIEEQPPDDPQAAPDDALDAALDAAFLAASQGTPLGAGNSVEHDLRATRELFAEIAANQARPVKNFVLELERGPVAREWLEICRPVVDGLAAAAGSAGLTDVVECLDRMRDALGRASAVGSPRIGEGARRQLLAAWGAAQQALPEAFAPRESDRRRETILLHSLLREIPDVGHVTFERLYGAGCASLDVLSAATPEDLSATTGIPHELAARICAATRDHHSRIAGLAADDLRARHAIELGDRLADLRRRHLDCERLRASGAWDAETLAARREARATRDSCARQIDLLLADLDQSELVGQLAGLPFEQRISRLEDFLSAPCVTAPERR